MSFASKVLEVLSQSSKEDYNTGVLKLAQDQGYTGGDFNGALTYIGNTIAGTSHVDVNDALKAAAVSSGYTSWEEMLGSDLTFGPTLLSDLSGLNVEFELDATLEASYDGVGSYWQSVTEYPYSGGTQTDYDYTNLVAFSGTAGDAAAYFDFTTTKTLLGRNSGTAIPPWWKAVPKAASGHKYWIAIALRLGDLSSGQTIYSTFSLDGMYLDVAATTGVVTFHSDGGGGAVSQDIGTLTAGTDSIIIFSYDHDTTTLRYWVNSQTNSSASFTQSGASPTSGLNRYVISGNAAYSTKLSSGSRYYTHAAGEAFLDDTAAQSIMNTLKARHSEGRYSFL